MLRIPFSSRLQLHGLEESGLSVKSFALGRNSPNATWYYMLKYGYVKGFK